PGTCRLGGGGSTCRRRGLVDRSPLPPAWQDVGRDVLRRPWLRLPVDAEGRVDGAPEALRSSRDDPVPADAGDEAHERGDLRGGAGAVAGAVRPPEELLRDHVPGAAPARPRRLVVEVPRPARGAGA